MSSVFYVVYKLPYGGQFLPKYINEFKLGLIQQSTNWAWKFFVVSRCQHQI
jgi:hypothetical protein